MRSTIVFIFALCVAAIGGCKKDSAATTVKPAAVETVAKPLPAQPPKVRRVVGSIDDSSATLLRYLPLDSSAVMGFNWKQARESEFVRSFDDKLLEAMPKMDGSSAKCGLDPLTEIHSFALGLGPDPTNTDAFVMAVSGDFTRESFEACLLATGGTVEGNRYSGTTNVHWPLGNVIVFANGLSSEELALVPSASAWDNAKLMVLVDEIDLHATFWIAGMVPPSLASSFGAMGTAPWGGYTAIDIGVGMRATVGLEFASEEEAKSMMTMINMGLGMAKGQPSIGELLDNVTVDIVGQAVVVFGEFTSAELEQMQKMIEKSGF